MRKQLFAVLVALALAVPLALIQAPVVAGPGDRYDGPYFGDGNFPPGCIRDMAATDPANVCHHMRTGINPLDSPKIDIAILVPASPFAERDLRVMRQSVDMWESGIDYLGTEMGLDWLAEGVDFNVTVDFLDPATTLAGDPQRLVDPEIVVIATNPVGGAGIGIDPVAFVFTDENLVPCREVPDALSFDYWAGLEGFDTHHGLRSGTYEEDCGGQGGNVCFAINGAVDPAPEHIDFFRLFDLVSHEFGHCLSLGHVGDSLETPAYGPTPSNDIMAYSPDPAGRTKCVSTLDVEVLAGRMSNYLDVSGDGSVNADDRLDYNDQVGQGGNPFHVMHPRDYLFASDTGSAMRCPQPDLGPLPGEPTDWTPTPTDPVLTLTSPDDGAATNGNVAVRGALEHRGPGDPPLPTTSTGSFDDSDDDASSALTEILDVSVSVDGSYLDATLHTAAVPVEARRAATYSLIINHKQIDSYMPLSRTSGSPRSHDGTAALPDGSSTWTPDAVSFHIPRAYLARAGVESPFYVRAVASNGVVDAPLADDVAPAADAPISIVGPPLHRPTIAASTTSFTGSFEPIDTSLGVTQQYAGLTVSGDRHTFHVPETSDVEFTLTWDRPADNDLDLFVYGPDGANLAGTSGATGNPEEHIRVNQVRGDLRLVVDPYSVLEATSYVLSATIIADADGDGIADTVDACPTDAGPADGCPITGTEVVHVYVDGQLAGSETVDTTYGADLFDISVSVGSGSHELRVDWVDHGDVIASATRTVTGPTAGPDADGDGVVDSLDNCADKPNADQSNIDGDRKGDVCDSDIDGDGHSNAKEAAHGTDPTDPNSYPGRRNLTAAF